MHYTNVAFKSMSDFYIKGIENISLRSTSIKDKISIVIIKNIIRIKELLNILGFEDNSILCTILFKEKPDMITLQKLKKLNGKSKNYLLTHIFKDLKMKLK